MTAELIGSLGELAKNRVSTNRGSGWGADQPVEEADRRGPGPRVVGRRAKDGAGDLELGGSLGCIDELSKELGFRLLGLLRLDPRGLLLPLREYRGQRILDRCDGRNSQKPGQAERSRLAGCGEVAGLCQRFFEVREAAPPSAA